MIKERKSFCFGKIWRQWSEINPGKHVLNKLVLEVMSLETA